MHRFYLLNHLILLFLIAISLKGCDDYNVVEPRFYDENNNENSIIPRVIKIEEPAWGETYPGQLILSFILADRYDISFYVMGTAGNVIIILYEGSTGGGTHELFWDLKDCNGNIIDDDEFYLLLKGGNEIDIMHVDLDEI